MRGHHLRSRYHEAIAYLAASEGLFLCPEGAACWAAACKLKKQGWLKPDQTVVIFNTASGLKYLDRFVLDSTPPAGAPSTTS